MFQSEEVQTYGLQVYDTDNIVIRATSLRGPFETHMVSISNSNNLLERT